MQRTTKNTEPQNVNERNKIAKIEVGASARCLNCGKEFILMSATQKYCCSKCGTEYRMKHEEEAKYPSVTFKCVQCGKIVITDGKKDRRKKFCCAQCEKRYWRHPHKK